MCLLSKQMGTELFFKYLQNVDMSDTSKMNSNLHKKNSICYFSLIGVGAYTIFPIFTCLAKIT